MAYSEGSQTKLLRTLLYTRKQKKLPRSSALPRYLFLQEAHNSGGLSARTCDENTFPRSVVEFVPQS